MSRRAAVILLLCTGLTAAATAPLWSQNQPAGGPPAGEDAEDAAPGEEQAAGGDDENGEPAPADISPNDHFRTVVWPLIALGVGIVIVLGLIIVLKVNAFIALITAALVVSLLAPIDAVDGWAGKIARVAAAFGGHAGSIGIVIALAAVIGKCMLDSGAADRIVRFFLRLFGEKRAPIALMGSGFVLSVPVFFDTVFYLLVPLARSLYRRTEKNYLKYILAIAAGGAITHTLVPPTPGPLLMASNLGFEVGWMILVGGVVALPAAIFGVVYATVADRLMPIPMRKLAGAPEPEPLADEELPPLWLSLAPILLPVFLIATNTVLGTIADSEHRALLAASDIEDWESFRADLREQQEGTPAARIGEVLVPAGDQVKDRAEREKVAALIEKSDPLTAEERGRVAAGLNRFVLGNRELYDASFSSVKINDTAKSLLGKNRLRMSEADVERLNRSLLESAWPGAIKPMYWDSPLRIAADISGIFGNANLALLIATVIAIWMLVAQRKLDRRTTADVVETSLMSAGVIILITAGGGAFGSMLDAAGVGPAIRSLFPTGTAATAGLIFLLLGFLISVVLKIAQGSSTVAMITASGMLASIATVDTLGCHPVYLACAIGAGSLVGSWMNDSGFWIFAKMGGLTETEALKSWTIMLALLGLIAFGVTLGLSQIPVVGTLGM